MSYPYPYQVDSNTNLWSSFILDRPEIGDIVNTPDGPFKVLLVLPGKHSSTGFHLEHGPKAGVGWYWYGRKM